ncbi:helix-turn-helix domain-containing protein [Roseibium sp. SCP14]|uniref:helix-turn-helix domain-containing protein n=1 Tax=Roseibium sp. SCP14 TaxID=3141375 RepID=UPI0033376161
MLLQAHDLTPCQCTALQPLKAEMQVTFALGSDQSMYAVEACLQLLELANRFSGRSFYRTSIVRNISSAFSGKAEAPRRMVVLFGNIDEMWFVERSELNILTVRLPRMHRVALVGGGALIASRLSYLKSRRLSVHPSMRDAALETGLRVDESDSPVCRDGPIHSAIGGLAALQMFAAIIAEDLGELLSARVLDYLGLKSADTGQRSEQVNRYLQLAGGQAVLQNSLSLMTENIETPLSSLEIANALNISSRQLARKFKRAFGESPMEVYRNLKLERAHQLLRHSDMTILEISIASGFGSMSSLRQRYRDRYQRTPAASRALRYQR